MSMARRVLLLGLLGVVVEDAQQQLRMPDVQLLVATGLDEVRSAFAQADIDHVIMGAGLDLEARLEIVREIFLASDKTTVHLKDFASGPDGFLPFVRSVLAGWQTTSSEREARTLPVMQPCVHACHGSCGGASAPVGTRARLAEARLIIGNSIEVILTIMSWAYACGQRKPLLDAPPAAF
jgi:hypothetical protein